MEHILKVLSYHGQIDAQISTNSGQIRPKDPQEHKEKLQVPCYSKFSRKEMITSFTWHEMRQFQQPHHYTVCQWGLSNCQNLQKVGHDIVIFNGNVLGHA